LDTGSNVSILQPGISSSDVKVTDARPYGVTGEILEGRQTVLFRLNWREFKHTVLVCSLPTEAAVIGTDLMTQTGAMISIVVNCCLITMARGSEYTVILIRP